MGTDAKRRQLERQLARLRELYLDGDLSREKYHDRRDVAQRELDALPVAIDNESGAEDLAAYLANLAVAWQEATPEERNRLARQLFSETVVSNQTAVAVVPRPEVRPYFEADLGTDIAHLRKRRGSVPHDRTVLGSPADDGPGPAAPV